MAVLYIKLKDGTELNNCYVFEPNVQKGSPNITDIDKIHQLFQKVHCGNKFIAFQTKMINGHIHVNNIEEYKILEEDL